MAIWGALDAHSSEATREVFEHTVVASTAYVSKLFQKSPGHLGLVCFTTAPSTIPEAQNEPSAQLHQMAEIARLLRDNGADPQWHGRSTFMWVIDAPSVEGATGAVVPVATADTIRTFPLRCGVAHGTEVGDPGDLLRLAAYRSNLAGAGEPVSAGFPDMASAEFALSQGERARLALISRNRGREVEPLVREALDLLLARYR